jgi:hypothetical protein
MSGMDDSSDLVLFWGGRGECWPGWYAIVGGKMTGLTTGVCSGTVLAVTEQCEPWRRAHCWAVQRVDSVVPGKTVCSSPCSCVVALWRVKRHCNAGKVLLDLLLVPVILLPYTMGPCTGTTTCTVPPCTYLHLPHHTNSPLPAAHHTRTFRTPSAPRLHLLPTRGGFIMYFSGWTAATCR